MRYVKTESSSPVDWVFLLEAMGGDGDILSEMAQLFLEFSPDQVRAVEDAIKLGDPDLLRSAAHRIKGSLAQFHVKVAWQLAAELEEHGQQGEVTLAQELWPTLREEVDRVRQAIEVWLEG